MSVSSVWQYISNAWDSFADRPLFEAVWSGYERVVGGIRKIYFQTNLDKGIDTISPHLAVDWYLVHLNSDNEIVVEDTPAIGETPAVTHIEYDIYNGEGISIPTLRDGVDTFENEYLDNVHYTVSDSQIRWIVPEDYPLDVDLWCPEAKLYDKRIYNRFGVLIQEEAMDSEAYLETVRGILWAYWQGPSIVAIRNAINIILGGQYYNKAGIISVVAATEIKVNHPDGTISTYVVTEDEESAHAVGDSVERFDLVANTVEVMDHINNPKWWDRYGLTSLNPAFGDGSFSDSEVAEANEIFKRFTWGVKIDGDLFSAANMVKSGIINRFLLQIKPDYTDHEVIIYNNFWSTDPTEETGDWVHFIDGNPDDDSELPVEEVIGIGDTVSFNNVSSLMYPDYAAENMSYEDYQSNSNETYDLDNDILVITEELEILEN